VLFYQALEVLDCSNALKFLSSQLPTKKGTGRRGTEPHDVFVLDPWWNPFVEDQAIARAHRIGQTEKVVAVKFIAKDTIDGLLEQKATGFCAFEYL
jgi:hypothetical protein